jgi:hypothetical protein
LAHFTGSGLNEIFDLDIDLFESSLQAALKIHKEEQNNIKRVVIVGYEKGD